MADKLEAHYQNRVYYFTLKEGKPGEISIDMYSTPYIFVKKGDKWVNHAFNRMDMGDGLIAAVIVAATSQVAL
ncbi:hypothetical protein [Mucilaginibacter sp. FT3.2]|uniref:hypothetical protein n=1 Tax=Mucilaginibacter sp. FT3.2 TaxID=2723090 RepID=UPI00161001F6|nr:hypothetical protein [Mucilaginibacter sp. FT3.2]MBB6231510.1 hypothetical protein [Mucilaginibacter sp. FT3.2]